RFRIPNGVYVHLAGDASSGSSAGDARSGGEKLKEAIQPIVLIEPGNEMVECVRRSERGIGTDKFLRQQMRRIAGHLQQFRGANQWSIEVDEPVVMAGKRRRI